MSSHSLIKLLTVIDKLIISCPFVTWCCQTENRNVCSRQTKAAQFVSALNYRCNCYSYQREEGRGQVPRQRSRLAQGLDEEESLGPDELQQAEQDQEAG